MEWYWWVGIYSVAGFLLTGMAAGTLKKDDRVSILKMILLSFIWPILIIMGIGQLIGEKIR